MSGQAPETSPPPPAQPPRKRRRAGRILLRIVSILILIIVLILLAVQIVLSSGLPRRILVEQAQKATGLRIEVDSFRAGWWGHSRLTGLRVSLPLADKPFAQVPEVDVDHTSLLMILLTRDISIGRIVLDRPKVDAVQQPTGQWNLRQVADLFTGKKESAAPAAKESSAAPKLPQILVREATIEVSDNQGRHTTVSPVNVMGKPSTPLAYELTAEAPNHLRLDGMIALNRTFHQQFAMRVRSIGDWIKPWADNFPPVSADAEWDGQILDGDLKGQLKLEPLKVGDRSVNGVTEVTLHDGVLSLSPQTLRVNTALPDPIGTVVFRSGDITIGNGRANVQRLLASTAGGLVQLNGQADLSLQSASLQTLWQDLQLPGDVKTSGNAEATLQTPLPGQPRVRLTLAASGDSPRGTWNTSMSVNGSGTSYSAMNWIIRSDAFTLNRGEDQPPLKVTDLLANVQVRGDRVALTNLSLLAPAVLRGSGAYDVSDGKWWLWINSTGWPIGRGDSFGFDINAWGDPDYVTLHQLYAHAGAAELVGSGYYGFHWPKPLSLHLFACHPPSDAFSRPQTGPIQGRFRGYADADGTLKPLAVNLRGQLHGRHLVLYDHAVDNIDAHLVGTIEPKRSQAHIGMKLAGGDWTIDAAYPGINSSWWQPSAHMDVSARQVTLAGLGRMLNIAGLEGRADGQWTIDLPSLSLRKVSMDGTVGAQEVTAADQHFGSISARTTLKSGVFRLRDVLIKQQGTTGQVHAAARIDLLDPQSLQGQFNVRQWVFDAPSQRMRAVVSAAGGQGPGGPLDYNLKSRTADGELTAQAVVKLDGQDAGHATLQVLLNSALQPATQPATQPFGALVSTAQPATRPVEQRINLSRLDANVLGGTITGQMATRVENLAAAADPWKWSDLHGAIHGNALHLDALSQWNSDAVLEGLGGELNFQAIAHPSVGPHPLEPQYLNVTVNTQDGHLQEMQLKSAQLHIYLGNERLVFAPDPDQESVISLANGEIYPWLRVSRHAGAGYFALLNGRFEQLDLNQLVHAVSPDAKPMPGRLAGNFHLEGDLNRPKALNGDAEVKITDSDLVNFTPLELLYNLLSAGGKPKSPIGYGRLDLALQQSQLSITNAHYFNRGIDALGSLTIKDVWKLKDSPISGGVVGTARPLKDIKLPFISDADKILSSLQSFLTAVGIDGTIDKPKVYQTSISTFGNNFLRAVLGDVKKAKQ